MGFIAGLVSGVLITLTVGFLSWIISWLNTRNRDGIWEVRVHCCKGGADGERTSHHMVSLPCVLGDGFEVSLDGAIGRVLRLEQGWPRAYPKGWLFKNRGVGIWKNDWEWWGYWTAYRRSDPEPRPQMKAGRPQPPPPPKR